MKTKPSLLLLSSLMILCACSLAQESAEDWYSRGQELYKNESFQEALSAYDDGLKMDPQNASAWHYRGLALAGMGHGVEANQSIQKAMGLIEQRLQEDPEDQEALWLMAEEMDLFGRSEEALEAYGRVAELNSSRALGAWIRESDILAALGRYNQSEESFSRAMALVPSNRSESQLKFWRRSGNSFLITKTWLINGRIHRVSIGLHNISSRSFDEIEQINSDFVAALQLKGKAIDLNRHGGFLMGSSLNWDVYSFNVPKLLPPAWPPYLTIAQINPTEDEFIEVTNGLKEAVSLQNWSLEIQGSRVSLPERSLLPGKAVRIHLGSGQGNETDLFLDSNQELNDTAGRVSLKDGSGAKVASLDYRTKLDGSIVHQVTHYPGTAESDLEYPGPGDDTGEWIVRGYALIKLGRYNEAQEALDKALEIASPDNRVLSSEAWNGKGDVLLAQGRNEVALAAYNKSLEFNPAFSLAWHGRGLAQKELGRVFDADQSFYVARKLGYTG